VIFTGSEEKIEMDARRMMALIMTNHQKCPAAMLWHSKSDLRNKNKPAIMKTTLILLNAALGFPSIQEVKNPGY